MSKPAVLTSVTLEALAQPIMDFLADRGVESWIRSDAAGGMFPNLEFLDGVQIMVDDANMEAARKALGEFEQMVEENLDHQNEPSEGD